MDLTFLLSAAIFTLLAIVVATSIFNGSSPAADLFNRSYFVQNEDAPVAEREEAAAPRLNGHAPDLVKEQDTADNWSEISGSSHDHWDVVKTVLSNEAATESPDIIAENEEEDDEQHLKYLPGKSRTHHLEMMLSKEELEEEQRVQREQLAAIFQLLKENTDTFGDVSDGDMEEQLRLYSI
ncbi:matrix-remodeling-associated protein 7 isoform 3-T3 [Synchiropus picturatus]